MKAWFSSCLALSVKGLLVSSVIGSSILPASGQKRLVTLEAGSVIPVRLNDALNSRTARQGDVFTARVVRWWGELLLPSGTVVEGVVRNVRRRNAEDSGALDIEFQRIYLPDGGTLLIRGMPVRLEREKDDGIHMRGNRIAARSVRRDDRSSFAGYGAGIGFIAGLVRKRPLEDTLLGASAGYLLGAARGPRLETRDLELQGGTALGVLLESGVEYEDRAPAANAVAERSQSVTKAGRGVPRGRGVGVGVVVGDREVPFSGDVRPMVLDEEVFVPIVPVLKHSGIDHRADREQRVVTVSWQGQSVRLSDGSRIVVIDGARRVRMSHAAQWIGEELYIPAAALETVFGADVEWDAITRMVLVDLSVED